MGDQLSETLKSLNMSKDEASKFEKAFKDPSFIKLFEQYAKEISDPDASGVCLELWLAQNCG